MNVFSLLLVAAMLAAGQAPTLVPGAPVHRDLSPLQGHTYELHLEAGQFLHVVVAPQGIDVAVALIGPDGKEALAVDLSRDFVMPEPIMVVAEIAGRYGLQVKSVRDGVPAGRYEVHIETLRQATAVDRTRVRGMRAFEDGMRLRDRAEQFERALEPLAVAQAAFRDAADRPYEARAALERAASAIYAPRPEALEWLQEARGLYREIGEPLGIARAIYLIGLAHERRGELPEAIQALDESLTRGRAIGSQVELNSLSVLGGVHSRMGELEKSADLFHQALPLATVTGVPRDEMMVLNNLGITMKNLGDYRLAVEYYERAIPLARITGDRRVHTLLLNNLGNVHRILGDYTRALRSHEDALAIARQLGDLAEESRSLNTIGLAYYRLGDFGKALDQHEQALAIRRRINDLGGQAASLDGAGQARHRLGDSQGAIENLTEALQIRRATVEPQAESDILLHLAIVERDRGNLAAALEHADAAVHITDGLRGQVVSPDLRASYVAAEHERYELYIDVSMRLHQQQHGAGFDVRALEASERGRARVLVESLIEARADIRQGIDAGLLEQERTYQQRLNAASAQLSRMLVRQADPKEIDAVRATMETLSTGYRQLQVRIRQESPTYAALTQPRAITIGEIQRDLLDTDTVLLEYALGEKRSWLWAITPEGLSSFELPPRREIEPPARRMYELLTARQPRAAEPPAARTGRVAQADEEWRRQSITLGRMLLGPAAGHLAHAWRGKRLLIVAPEILQYVPFSALADPAAEGHALVVDHEIVSLPSASVLAVIRQQAHGRPLPAKQLAILADPVFEADDPRLERKGYAHAHKAPAVTLVARALRSASSLGTSSLPRLSRLPFSRQEARAISTFVPARLRLEAIGFEATRATAMSGQLESYRIVHFATHGFLNSEQPELSGLVLSLVDREGKAQDGFLRLSDVYNLRLPADVVVLSACQTAIGKEIRGEGLVGLTRGFMYAGARRVVASLWQVDDLATAELMRVFYRGMLKDKLSPAAALRAAQRELVRQPRWSSPFYWSAFVLQGEWR